MNVQPPPRKQANKTLEILKKNQEDFEGFLPVLTGGEWHLEQGKRAAEPERYKGTWAEQQGNCDRSRKG